MTSVRLSLVAALGTALLFHSLGAQSSDLPRPGARLQLSPPQLVVLLDAIPQNDLTTRWELASITLEVISEAYRSALQGSTQEQPSRADRRRKLARWQHATADLIRSIDQRRQALLVGSAFSIYADAQQQIIVTVEGQPIVLAGLTRGDDVLLENTVVDRFCAFNDCRVLREPDHQRPQEISVPAGHWQIRQSRPPVLQIGDLLHCRFDNLEDRERKARRCHDAATEVATLRQALGTAQQRGIAVNWSLLNASRDVSSDGLRLILDDSGTWLVLALPTLTALPQPDWEAVIETSRGAVTTAQPMTLLLDGDRLW